MASAIEGYTLGWNDYSNNFSISLRNLLEQKELTDVTLVADGHLFNAHRLVLSALSPYFRQMFTQMPVNQQAFVFLKDVPKETLENLINYIYCGNVNVEKEHLEGFFETAKALGIKGLGDENSKHTFDIEPSTFISTAPKYKRLQYQSTRTTPIPDQVQPNCDEPSHYEPPMDTVCQQQDNFECDDRNEVNVNGNLYGEFFGSDAGDGDSTAMNQKFSTQDDHKNDGSTYVTEEKPAELIVSRPAKRIQCSIFEYNIFADIRDTWNGPGSLFYDNNKFKKHNKTNKYGQQRWECCKRKSKRCKAAARTMEINGIMMMKIVYKEHSH